MAESKVLLDDPIIVLGIHHSGTSILAELLHLQGVFMNPTNKIGKRRYEPKFFNKAINGFILGVPSNGREASW